MIKKINRHEDLEKCKSLMSPYTMEDVENHLYIFSSTHNHVYVCNRAKGVVSDISSFAKFLGRTKYAGCYWISNSLLSDEGCRCTADITVVRESKSYKVNFTVFTKLLTAECSDRIFAELFSPKCKCEAKLSELQEFFNSRLDLLKNSINNRLEDAAKEDVDASPFGKYISNLISSELNNVYPELECKYYTNLVCEEISTPTIEESQKEESVALPVIDDFEIQKAKDKYCHYMENNKAECDTILIQEAIVNATPGAECVKLEDKLRNAENKSQEALKAYLKDCDKEEVQEHLNQLETELKQARKLKDNNAESEHNRRLADLRCHSIERLLAFPLSVDQVEAPSNDEDLLLNELANSDVFNQYRMMLTESARIHQTNGNTSIAQSFTVKQQKLYELLSLLGRTVSTIAFVGAADVNPVKLFGDLFDVNIALRGSGRRLIKFCYGTRYELIVHRIDNVNNILSRRYFNSAEEIFNLIYAINIDDIKNIVFCVRMPHCILSEGLVIKYVPGTLADEFGSTSEIGLWDTDFFADVNTVFGVIPSQTAINATFYNRHLAGRCTNIIVQETSPMDENERETFRFTNGITLERDMDYFFVNSNAYDFQDFISRWGIRSKKSDYVYKNLICLFDELNLLKRQHGNDFFFVEHRKATINRLLSQVNRTSTLLSSMQSTVRR